MSLSLPDLAKAGVPIDDELRAPMQELLGSLEGEMENLPFSRSLRRQYSRFKKALDTSTDGKEISILGLELYANVVAELESKVFLMIPEQDADLYAQSEPPFGKEAAEAYPEATYDVEAATRCLALGECTAVVLHLMRVHEILLRHLGKKLGIKVAKEGTIEFQEWQRVIDEIQAKVKTLPTGKQRGARAGRKREFYNELAGYLFHIKEAWRVPATHARAKFDDREARVIWENTKALMHSLAAWKP